MTDPGLPPKPHSLNLLQSLVNEEEEKDARNHSNRSAPHIVIPSSASRSLSPDFYDSNKQQISRENSSLSASFTEYKMKDAEIGSKVKPGNPNAGFKGKKMKKPKNGTNNDNSVNKSAKKLQRPFSADYNKYKRQEVSSKNERPSTTHSRKTGKKSSAKGQRSRSPRSYSSDTYSSDDEYIRKKKYRSESDSSHDRRASPERDNFFDNEIDTANDFKNSRTRNKSSSSSSRSRSRSRSSYSSRSSSRSSSRGRRSPVENKRGRRKRDNSRSRSRSSSNDSRNNERHINGHGSVSKGKGKNDRNAKTVYVNKDGNQRSNSEGADLQRMVVVEDYGSDTFSEDEAKQRPPLPSTSKQHTQVKSSKPLLSRKKRQNYRIFQINPDTYIEGKLHQKYTELEELLTCSFVDQRSHVTRHHLYQMELLRDQYESASHGHHSAATIIPRSLPGDVRARSGRPLSGRPSSAKRHSPSKRPSSAKQLRPKSLDNDQESGQSPKPNERLYVNHSPSPQKKDDKAYKTLRSVMAAENARDTDRIRTDVLVDRPASGKRSSKKSKKISAKMNKAHSDTEEDVSEKPSIVSSNCSKTNSSPSTTPRSKLGATGIDHHIKYTENEKLKKWLKEKDKIYRQHVREERKKKREEREKLINEANEKIEHRLTSQKRVKQWMKEKNKEQLQKLKEERRKAKHEEEVEKKKEPLTSSLTIRPQSAPTRRSDDVKVDKDQIKGADTPDYVRDQIHMKREIAEENKQAKLAQTGRPHPPQTKFIYKRPVAGKIKFKMQITGKNPASQKKSEEAKDGEKSDTEKAKEMRMSYDQWVKKKQEDDSEKRKLAAKQREMAKSDPELERIIPALGRKRIEEKLNSRKRIDTGLKDFDNKTNKSFGGGDFDGEAIEAPERPRSAYRLESDRGRTDSPALSISSKKLQRPSTAPSKGRTPPKPKKSVNSPRQAIIPSRADKVMSQEDTRNPYQIPFPPEKGIPAHVADRQRRIFADIVTRNLDEIEQRALLNAELIKEGVSDEDIEQYKRQMEMDLARYKSDQKRETDDDLDDQSSPDDQQHDNDDGKRANISELMYSPRRRGDSSESSSDNEALKENVETAVSTEVEKEASESTQQSHGETTKPLDDVDSKTEVNESKEKGQNDAETVPEVSETDKIVEQEGSDDKKEQNEIETADDHRHYKTYENLNEIKIDTEVGCTDNSMGNDILTAQEEMEDDMLMSGMQYQYEGDTFDIQTEEEYQEYLERERERHERNNIEAAKIKVVADNDPNVVGILKERKPEDTFPDPETSDDDETKPDDKSRSPQGDLSNSMKRVSFNERNEVFQSFESTSTDTVTPAPSDVDPTTEGLDAQNYADDFEPEQDKKDMESGGVDNDANSGTTFITDPDGQTTV